MTTAAATPIGMVTIVASTAKDTLIQIACGRPLPRASVKFFKPTNGALSHRRSVYLSRSISAM